MARKIANSVASVYFVLFTAIFFVFMPCTASVAETEKEAETSPYYFIVIHNEPCNINGGEAKIRENYKIILRMIALADKYHIKLTLMFSPQLAD